MQFFLSFHKCYTTTKASPKKNTYNKRRRGKNHNHNQTNDEALEADSESYQVFVLSFIFFPLYHFVFIFQLYLFFCALILEKPMMTTLRFDYGQTFVQIT